MNTNFWKDSPNQWFIEKWTEDAYWESWSFFAAHAFYHTRRFPEPNLLQPLEFCLHYFNAISKDLIVLPCRFRNYYTGEVIPADILCP